jgi:ATP-binding cassette, subfamily B, bacterial
MKTWRSLIQIMRYRPALFVPDVIAYILQYSSSMIPVLIVREILNRLTGEAQVDFSIQTLLLLWAMVELIRAGLFTTVVVLEVHFFLRFWALLRANLFDRILKRPGAQALPYSTGEAVSRFRDDVQAIQGFMSYFYNFVATGVFALIAMTIMLSINARVTVFVFLPLVLITFLTLRVRERLTRYRAATQTSIGRVTGALGEMFGAVQAVKVAGAEERLIAHLRKLNDARRAAVVRENLLLEMLNAVIQNVTNFGTGVILLLAAESMRLGQFTVGDFALFVYYLGWVTLFTNNIGQLIASYRQAGVSFERMQILMQGAPEAELVKHRPVYFQSEPPQPEAVAKMPLHRFESLDVRGLTFRHPDTGRGVEDISFHVKQGQMIVITGKVGSGKTTLLRAVLGLLPAQSGSIHWNNQLITDAGDFFVPPRCAYTPQVAHLFSDSLRDNLLMGLPSGDLETAIKLAVMEDDLAQMEHGFDTLIGTRGMRLSGGQLQRAAIGRAVIRQPELLVFDDPSSALDVDTERQLWERIFAVKQVTCIVVSHRPHVLKRADHILWLDEGRLIASGHPSVVLEEHPKYNHIKDVGCRMGRGGNDATHSTLPTNTGTT